MNLQEIKNIKLLKEDEIAYPEKTNENGVKLIITPTTAYYLYEKDADGNFVEDGGLVEKITLDGRYYRGVLDSESKNGNKIVRGYARELYDQPDKELILNVRDPISNTESVLFFGPNGDSIVIQQSFDEGTCFYAFYRDEKGNIVSATSNKGVTLYDEGKEKRFFYTFADEFKGKKADSVFGDILVFQSDYNLIPYRIYPGTNAWYCNINQNKPYYAYTLDNKKYYYDPVKKVYTLVDEGPKVQKLIEKVKAEALKQLTELGFDKYDKKTRTYKKETQPEK